MFRKSLLIVIFFVYCFNCSAMCQNKRTTKENSTFGATIERNLEAYTLLERAENFIENKKYQDAILILKNILEQYPNALISYDTQFFIPFREKVFEIILKLPAEARTIFFTEINSIASGLYKKATEDLNEALLEEIYQKYYLSEYGDDAAMALGYLAMEHGYFSKAIGLFDKALKHPQCSINADKLKLSIYFLYKLMNNESAASSFNAQLIKNPRNKSLLADIDKSLSDFNLASVITESKNIFNNKKKNWTTVWTHKNESPFRALAQNINGTRVQRRVQIQLNNSDAQGYNGYVYDEEAVYVDWKKNLWFPSAKSIVNANGIVIRKGDLLTCYELNNLKKIKWEANLEVGNKNSVTENYYNYNNNTAQRIPLTRDEILSFSDQVGKQMATNGNILFALSNHEKTGYVMPYMQRRWFNNQQDAKFDGNVIFALDVKSGKKLWKLGDNSNKKDSFYNAVFLHLPIETPYGFYVTFSQENDVYGALINKQRNVIWKKYLCSSDSNYEMVTNNGASIYGDDSIYITIDYGVIIKINALDGNFCWIKRYQLKAITEETMYAIPSIKGGVEINSLVYHMGKLVVCPSDSQTVYVLNGISGDTVYMLDTDFEEYRRYLIGSDETGYYMAGSRGIRKYSYFSSEYLWQSEIKNNYGRGLLDNQSILYPSNQQIYKVDCMTGKKNLLISVNMGHDTMPIGNLSVYDSFLVSTGYDTIHVTNEVNSIIESLTLNIQQNKSGEVLHRRGLLYAELGDHKNAFKDIIEALQLKENNIRNNELYRESILDIYEQLVGTPDIKNFQDQILELTEGFTDGNQKSFLYYLQADNEIQNKKFDNALQFLVLSASQSNGEFKQRTVKLNEKEYSTFAAAILRLHKLWQEKLISEDRIVNSINNLNRLPSESIFLIMINTFDSASLRKNLFNIYLKKCNQQYSTSVIKSFLMCLQYHEDPIINLSAKYYLMKQNIQMGEYYNALTSLNFLRSQKADSQIYIVDGVETLGVLLNVYNRDLSFTNEMFNPAVRQITDPPLNELWKSSKFSNSKCDVMMIGGTSLRPEYVERNIFLMNRVENKIHCINYINGEKIWTFDLPENKTNNKMNSNDNMIVDEGYSVRNYEFSYRMDGIGILNVGANLIAVDLKTGKKVWTRPLEKFDIMDFNNGCLIKLKNNKIYVNDGFTGQDLYSINIKEDIKRAYAYHNRLIIINNDGTNLYIFNLYSGELIKEVKFDYSLNGTFTVLINDSIILQRSDSILVAYSIKTGSQNWSLVCPDKPLNQNSIFSIDDKTLLFYSGNWRVNCFNIEKGAINWSFDIPDRALYRNTDIYPVSGNDSLIILCAGRPIQNKEVQTATDNYLILDMKTGALKEKITVEIGQQDLWRPRSAWNVAFKGDVIPKLTNNNNNSVLQFIRKRDSNVVKKFSINVKSAYENEMFFAKGHVFMLGSNRDLIAYGNPVIIEKQSELFLKLGEFFNVP